MYEASSRGPLNVSFKSNDDPRVQNGPALGAYQYIEMILEKLQKCSLDTTRPRALCFGT
jgi:hypothetical protein